MPKIVLDLRVRLYVSKNYTLHIAKWFLHDSLTNDQQSFDIGEDQVSLLIWKGHWFGFFSNSSDMRLFLQFWV